MEATKILKDEHRVIERVLFALETAAGRLEAGEPVDPAIFLQAAEFMSGFADGCHHKKEEGVLFPAMQAAGVQREGGPIGVMLEEHEEGRRLTRAMRGAAERLQNADESASNDLVASATQYIALLRQHIAKEDNVLFPMADQVIQGSAQSDVADAFADIEQGEAGEGAHERFLALADSIERGVAG